MEVSQRRRMHKIEPCRMNRIHQVNEMKQAEQTDQKAWSKLTRRQAGGKKAPPFDNFDYITSYIKGKRWEANDAGSHTPSGFTPHQRI